MKFFITLLVMLFSPLAMASPELRVRGPHFVDPQGRVVMLRGVNVTGKSKIPPYLPFSDLRQLDPLQKWGMNTIRLLFSWEGFEQSPGMYDQKYLDAITQVVDAAWERGIYTIVDMHQDSFSRYVGTECGDGFPAWISGSIKPNTPPKNCGPLWAVQATFSIPMHMAFKGFFANKFGARDHFIEVWRRLAHHFKTHRGVIGYDILNEPWGDETSEITPLYFDAQKVIQKEDPSAILFIEPQILSLIGLSTPSQIPVSHFDNAVFAPHFYDGLTVGTGHFNRADPTTKRLFKQLPYQAEDWNVPLFVGEFGGDQSISNVDEFVEYQYDLLDRAYASATQWGYTPTWNPVHKDGWNDENYSIVDQNGALRKNFKIRPYPQKVSGFPGRFRVKHTGALGITSVELSWYNDPHTGETELSVPTAAIFGSRKFSIQTFGDDLRCSFNGELTRLTCHSPHSGNALVRVVNH